VQAAGAVPRWPAVAAMQLDPHQPQATLLMHSPQVVICEQGLPPGVPGV